MMRILLLADMRSPHSVGWVHGLTQIGMDPVVVSSRRLSATERSRMPDHVRRHVVHEPTDGLSRARAFSTAHRGVLGPVRGVARRRKRAINSRPNENATPEGTGRIELPLELLIARQLGHEVLSFARRCRPQLVHALRIPFEGIAVTPIMSMWPTAISVWGSDLAQQAPAATRLAAATRQSLASIRGLHADCNRDLALAHEWGAPVDAIGLVAAGNMGFDEEVFNTRGSRFSERQLIVCPRGHGSQINYIGFLRVADRITRRYPHVCFVAARLAGNPAAEEARKRSAHPDRIMLTEHLSPRELADIYRNSLAVVSPSISDGTPNSVLEGMSCGAIPIVGDIASLRELLEEKLPGSLFDPLDEADMERRLIEVLEAPESSWLEASETACRIAQSGWSRESTQSRVQAWYEHLASS